jgi:hypothetical protein
MFLVAASASNAFAASNVVEVTYDAVGNLTNINRQSAAVLRLPDSTRRAVRSVLR